MHSMITTAGWAAAKGMWIDRFSSNKTDKTCTAVTIAIRYAHARRQGSKGEDGLEKQIITYPSVHSRLLPILSRAYVFLLLGRNLVRDYILMLLTTCKLRDPSFSGKSILRHVCTPRFRRHISPIGNARHNKWAEDPCQHRHSSRSRNRTSKPGRTWIQRSRRRRTHLRYLPPQRDVRNCT